MPQGVTGGIIFVHRKFLTYRKIAVVSVPSIKEYQFGNEDGGDGQSGTANSLTGKSHSVFQRRKTFDAMFYICLVCGVFFRIIV